MCIFTVWASLSLGMRDGMNENIQTFGESKELYTPYVAVAKVAVSLWNRTKLAVPRNMN